MSKRKNISKQDLKNIDLVLENDIQCSGLNIGGRAYEFVAGGYKILTLTGNDGTLTNDQLLDIVSNDNLVIKINNDYYRKVFEDTTYITYNVTSFVGSTSSRRTYTININKNTKYWNKTTFETQKQNLTISDVNENLTVVENKASIINGVLYIHFRASATDTISGGTTLVKYNNTLTNQHAFIGLLANSGTTITGFVDTGCEVKLNTNLSSGNVIDIELSILL